MISLPKSISALWKRSTASITENVPDIACLIDVMRQNYPNSNTALIEKVAKLAEDGWQSYLSRFQEPVRNVLSGLPIQSAIETALLGLDPSSPTHADAVISQLLHRSVAEGIINLGELDDIVRENVKIYGAEEIVNLVEETARVARIKYNVEDHFDTKMRLVRMLPVIETFDRETRQIIADIHTHQKLTSNLQLKHKEQEPIARFMHRFMLAYPTLQGFGASYSTVRQTVRDYEDLRVKFKKDPCRHRKEIVRSLSKEYGDDSNEVTTARDVIATYELYKDKLDVHERPGVVGEDTINNIINAILALRIKSHSDRATARDYLELKLRHEQQLEYNRVQGDHAQKLILYGPYPGRVFVVRAIDTTARLRALNKLELPLTDPIWQLRRQIAINALNMYLPLLANVDWEVKTELFNEAVNTLIPGGRHRVETLFEKMPSAEVILSPIKEQLLLAIKDDEFLNSGEFEFDFPMRKKGVAEALLKSYDISIENDRWYDADQLPDIYGMRCIVKLKSQGNLAGVAYEDEKTKQQNKVKLVEACYRVHDIVARLYETQPHRHRDYYKNRKPNGYEGLHETGRLDKSASNRFLADDFEPVFEIQIRDVYADAEARFGTAAHSEKVGRRTGKRSMRKANRIIMLETHLDAHIAGEELIPDGAADRMIIGDLRGRLWEVPRDITALDVAAFLANVTKRPRLIQNYIGAKVDDELWYGFDPHSLSRLVRHASRVIIETSPGYRPNCNWVEFVRTETALDAIVEYGVGKRINPTRPTRDRTLRFYPHLPASSSRSLTF